ncbi:MAG: Ig-like domain-containing protein, partial [Wenzhouxiangella sp.]|nr:Ig-like domain-containing protein [Wenzhouxiangella sp.]
MNALMNRARFKSLQLLFLIPAVTLPAAQTFADEVIPTPFSAEEHIPHGMPKTEAELRTALDNLRALKHRDLASALNGIETRLDQGRLSKNDRNLLCIGAFTAPFSVAFGIGLVPNPPWDYLLGQVPAWAANLGLKFCPAVLDAPADIEVEPNVATADGPNCAYDFSQPIIAGAREDFMGVPYKVLGNWTFTQTPSSRGFGTPRVFHYNTPVELRMLLPGEAPPGFLQEIPEPQFVAEIGPFGIRAPSNEVFNAVGCALDGSVPISNTGGPCPIDLDRTLRLPVGQHPVTWRAETQIELLDTLPPIYVPGTPPGSKKGIAKAVLKNIYQEVRGEVAGEFLESYPTGVVSLATQAVRVLDTTPPSLGFVDPALATFRVEALEPGGASTLAFRDLLRDSIVATDACNRTPQVSVPLPTFLPLGSHPITWTARDAGPARGGGVNQSTLAQTIIVEDTLPPQIAPPPPVVVESNTAPVVVETGSPQVFDIADLEPTIEFDGPVDFPFGVTTVRWRAVDASGNASPWVDQTINVKLTGSNNAPVADDVIADAISFEEVEVQLTASDVDGDALYFYIDRQPDEGFFVAPLLPTFVQDFRVEAQGDPGSICLGGGTLPPQNYVFLPEYITTNDDG